MTDRNRSILKFRVLSVLELRCGVSFIMFRVSICGRVCRAAVVCRGAAADRARRNRVAMSEGIRHRAEMQIVQCFKHSADRKQVSQSPAAGRKSSGGSHPRRDIRPGQPIINHRMPPGKTQTDAHGSVQCHPDLENCPERCVCRAGSFLALPNSVRGMKCSGWLCCLTQSAVPR